MKLNKVSATIALLTAAVGLGGCSSDQKPSTGENGSSIGFHLLTTDGVSITSVNYDLNTQGGADVTNGSIPVPDDDSEISLGIQSLGAGDYSLAFSATGMYMGQAVPCASDPVLFHLNASQELTLPTITLTCTITNQADTTGGVNASVNVAVETITIGSVIETFTYGPQTVKGHNNMDGVCTYSPVTLKILNANSAVSYSWAATPDGTFGGSATNGTYTCASGGTKTLTLTGTNGTTTSTKSVTINCDASTCGPNPCGNGTVDPGEQCDENTPRCTNCQITPVCGDGVVDAPEQCDSASLPTDTCDINCHTIVHMPTCGDGTVDPGEQCDNGSANSDTVANACRTNCQNPSCGDGVADTGEQCDSGAANSDTTPNACRTTCQSPKCGDGVIDTGEDCDATNLPTATCDATCKTIAAGPTCDQCLHTNAGTASYQATYCDTVPGCVDVEQCIMGPTGNGCFSPVPANCYCGPSASDLDSCDLPDFVPVGPCAAVIKANAGGDAAANADVLNRLFAFGDWPTGTAISLLDTASRVCATECASNF